ncbi:hypothetical protein [Bosea thiooxidans]
MRTLMGPRPTILLGTILRRSGQPILDGTQIPTIGTKQVARRLKTLEDENAPLRKPLAEQLLDNAIPKAVAAKMRMV